MKTTIEHNDVKVSFELTPDEMGKLLPYSIRAFLNPKVATIQTTSLLRQKLELLQKEVGWKKFSLDKRYMKDDDVSLFISKIPFFIKSRILSRVVSEFSIGSYEESNVFFAIVELLHDKLKKKHVNKMYLRLKDNDQAALLDFFEETAGKKPELITQEILEFVESKNFEKGR